MRGEEKEGRRFYKLKKEEERRRGKVGRIKCWRG
jgi:hypothetical protein